MAGAAHQPPGTVAGPPDRLGERLLQMRTQADAGTQSIVVRRAWRDGFRLARLGLPRLVADDREA